jgi:dimethylargininase
MAGSTIAITREVPRSIGDCQLTHLARSPIDVGRARAQHAAYEAALRRLGCVVERLPEAPQHPDSVFVEDCAVVFDEFALLTRPGAEARRGELEAIGAALTPYRERYALEEPATLDGGDVLVVGKRIFVGLTGRTNFEGLRQLRLIVERHGYSADGVNVTGCLHLKSAATAIDEERLLVDPRRIEGTPFRDLELLEIDPREPQGANTVRVGDTLLFPADAPRTAERLGRQPGVRLELVDATELAKAEGALSCCSLIFRSEP